MVLSCALRAWPAWPFVLACETDSLLISQEDSGHVYLEGHKSQASLLLTCVPLKVYLSSVPNQKGHVLAKSRTTRSLPLPLPPSSARVAFTYPTTQTHSPD